MTIPKWLPVNIRILLRYRLYSGISLIGMSIAIASCWFIANYVSNSYHYDAFQNDVDRIYRLDMEVDAAGSADQYATTGMPPAEILSESYSGIEGYARMSKANAVVKIGNNLFREEGFFYINPGIVYVFTFPFISGDKGSCFVSPNSIVLSKSLAEKYFHSTEIIDKQIKLGDTEFNVTGVFEDWPENSHLNVNALLYSGESKSGYEAQDWFDLNYFNYVKVSPSTTQQDLNRSLSELVSKKLTPALQGSGMDVKVYAEPLPGLYFSDGLIDDVPKGNMMYVRAIIFAGLMILLIAGINYINLSLTRSTQRSKEISLKKVLGITKGQLLLQNLSESFLMSCLILMISGIIVFLLDDLFSYFSGFHAFVLAGNTMLLVSLFCITFIFGLLGKTYSGLYLTFSQKQIGTDLRKGNAFKKVLLGFQFAIAAIIIIATLTMNRQIDFMKNTDLGFTKDHVMIVPLPDVENAMNKSIQFREEVNNMASVKMASMVGGGALPGEENGKEVFEVSSGGNKIEKVFNFYRIDDNYFNLLNIRFAAGRNFDRNRISDTSDAVVINEILAKTLQWKDPIGKTIWYDKPRKVIGVVKNFHNKSLHSVIEPVVFIYDQHFASNLLVRTSPQNVKKIKTVWSGFFPDHPFTYIFFDQFLDAKYAKEDHLAKLLGLFSFVSLSLSCMGLFALFSLHILQKTKEISIRKVLGADALHLLKTLTRNYLVVTLISIGAAIPLAWYFMNEWLSNFSYKVSLDPNIFVVSSLLVLTGGILALLFHVIKALHVNPAESLKTE